MTCYVVTFEVASEATRQKVHAQLKSYGAYCPVHAACWAIVTDQSAVSVRDKVMTVLEASDRVFVVRSGTEAAWSGTYGAENSEWLKKNL